MKVASKLRPSRLHHAVNPFRPSQLPLPGPPFRVPLECMNGRPQRREARRRVTTPLRPSKREFSMLLRGQGLTRHLAESASIVFLSLLSIANKISPDQTGKGTAVAGPVFLCALREGR